MLTGARAFPPPMSAKADIVIGVEIGPELIRAIACDASFIPHGKARRSTKLARGTATVLDRVERCVEDAADEGDLELADIRAVGVAFPGDVDQTAERLASSAVLGWKSIRLEQLLAARLGRPVFAANDFQLRTHAAWRRDLQSAPGLIVALFWDGTFGGGLLRDGRPLDAGDAPEFHHLLEETQRAWGQRLPAEWLHRSARDWRKAFKRGDRVVGALVDESLKMVGQVVARIAANPAPDVILIGGGMMEDRRAPFLEAISSHAQTRLGPDTILPARLVASELGDNAALFGAAGLALGEAISRACAPQLALVS